MAKTKKELPGVSDFLANLSKQADYWEKDGKPKFELKDHESTEKNARDLTRLLTIYAGDVKKAAIIKVIIERIEGNLAFAREYEERYPSAGHAALVSTIPADSKQKRPEVTLLSLNWQAFEQSLAESNVTAHQRTLDMIAALQRTINEQHISVIQLQQVSPAYIDNIRKTLGKDWDFKADHSGLMTLYKAHEFTGENHISHDSAIGPVLTVKLDLIADDDIKVYISNQHCGDDLRSEVVEGAVKDVISTVQTKAVNGKGANERAAIFSHSSNNHVDAIVVYDPRQKNIEAIDSHYVYINNGKAYTEAQTPHYATTDTRKLDLRFNTAAENKTVINHQTAVAYEKHLQDVLPEETLMVRTGKDSDGAPLLAITFKSPSMAYNDFALQLADVAGITHKRDAKTVTAAATDSLTLPLTKPHENLLIHALNSLLTRNAAYKLIYDQHTKLSRGSIVNSTDVDKNREVSNLVTSLRVAANGSKDERTVEHFSNVVREWEKDARSIADHRNALSSGLTNTQKTLHAMYELLNPANNLRNELLAQWSVEKARLEKLSWHSGVNQGRIVLINALVKALENAPGNSTYLDFHTILVEQRTNANQQHLKAHRSGFTKTGPSRLEVQWAEQIAVVASHLSPQDLAKKAAATVMAAVTTTKDNTKPKIVPPSYPPPKPPAFLSKPLAMEVLESFDERDDEEEKENSVQDELSLSDAPLQVQVPSRKSSFDLSTEDDEEEQDYREEELAGEEYSEEVDEQEEEEQAYSESEEESIEQAKPIEASFKPAPPPAQPRRTMPLDLLAALNKAPIDSNTHGQGSISPLPHAEESDLEDLKESLNSQKSSSSTKTD